ncbi:MAG: radical SAM protein [Bacteroidota bacterium]
MPGQSVLLLTPPFTQLNTPYPATCYIKGFLNTQGITSFQMDVGIEVIGRIFSKEYLRKLFDSAADSKSYPESIKRMIALKNRYIHTIEPTLKLLQQQNPTLAYSIGERNYLPEGNRFLQLDDLEWAFGTLGIQDKARHLATLYLEDLGDFIKEVHDPHFGFSRYAERLGMSASSFDPILKALEQPLSIIDELSLNAIEERIKAFKPTLVCMSVPFPGNLFGALRIGQFIKRSYPDVKVVMGGGYPNTELRSITDARVFDFIDFITLDDGERPILNLIEYLDGNRDQQFLKRTFLKNESSVVYVNGGKELDIPFSKTGTPDYSDLPLTSYLSVIELANPMHRLWSDGRWNKLTMAHGCYWKKCSFCDISLDYIKNYEPVGAQIICDRIEEIIGQTGETGFHFVDEAAPPALMKELAIEILKRNLVISWWTNIRFEQHFTSDLCRLLKASGCIAVSGGLEVASDRLLELMKKGVSVAQVAQVASNFTESGIMVHAYLMYGFPTQTAQETIDSLEMVRQLFMNGVLQSGFWHQFAMTAHSPVGMSPESYQVRKIGPEPNGFAINDLVHDDHEGTEHQLFSEGLKKSLFNYMHDIGFDLHLSEWFDFETPETTIPGRHIERVLYEYEGEDINRHSRMLWVGHISSSHSENNTQRLHFETNMESLSLQMDQQKAEWLIKTLNEAGVNQSKASFGDFQKSFEQLNSGEFDKWLESEEFFMIRQAGLLIV